MVPLLGRTSISMSTTSIRSRRHQRASPRRTRDVDAVVLRWSDHGSGGTRQETSRQLEAAQQHERGAGHVRGQRHDTALGHREPGSPPLPRCGGKAAGDHRHRRHKNDPYEVYSFLISVPHLRPRDDEHVSTDGAGATRDAPGPARISHKQLNCDKVVGRIIKPFPEAADEIPEFLLCVAIDTRIDSLQNAEFLREGAPKLKWDRRTLERAMRVITYIGLLLSGFARPGQSVFWLSDEDAMIANNRMIAQLQIMIPSVWRSLLSFDLPFAQFADTRISNRDILAEDIVSVVDVAAGATREQLRNGTDGTFPLSGRSIPTMQWLCNGVKQAR